MFLYFIISFVKAIIRAGWFHSSCLHICNMKIIPMSDDREFEYYGKL